MKVITEVIYPLGGERDLWPLAEPITAELVMQRIKNIDVLDVLQLMSLIFNEVYEQNKENILAINIAREAVIEHFKLSYGIKWPTETDMIEAVIAKYKVTYLELLADIEFKPTINAPKKLNKESKLVRPDTLDTYKKMWEEYQGDLIHQYHILNHKLPMAIISSQPTGYYQYQQAIAAFHDKPIAIKAIASAADNSSINFSVLFDALARTIYARKDMLKKE